MGIGTTTPAQKLSVVGTIESTSGGFKFPNGTVQTTASAGKILQVVSATKTDTQAISSATPADVTGLSVSITPSSTSSKILVFVSVLAGNAANGDLVILRLLRDTTALANNTSVTYQGFGAAASNGTYNRSVGYVNFNYLDSPATTLAITYKIQAFNGSTTDTGYINRWALNTDYGGSSTITVMEVGP